jgi:hypothetical protein
MADALALASLEIEGIMRMFPELVKSSYALESRFKSTRATQVGTKSFRLPMKYSRPEDYSALDLNGGTLSMGDFASGTMVPSRRMSARCRPTGPNLLNSPV